MKKIWNYVVAFFVGAGAILAAVFLRNRREIEEIIDRQEDEEKRSEDKLEEARANLEKAREAAKELNKNVEDLSDDEVEEYWKKKLQ